MTLTENAYIFYFGLPIATFWVMATIAIKNNWRALEHRLLASSFILFSALFAIEWMRHLVSLEYSAYITVWGIGTVMVLALSMIIHVCILIYEKHTKQKFPIYKPLLYGAFMLQIAIGLSPIAPIASDFYADGIWIRRDTFLYDCWIILFVTYILVMNITIVVRAHRVLHPNKEAKQLFQFLLAAILVTIVVFPAILLLTPTQFSPSLPALYMMVAISLCILFGMYKFKLFPQYALRYITMFDKSPVCNFILDEDFNVTEVNQQSEQYFQTQFLGSNLLDLMNKTGNMQAVLPLLNALQQQKEIVDVSLSLNHFITGEAVHLLVNASEIEENGEILYYVMFLDRTVEVEQEAKIRQLAYFDSLTALPNRAAFMQEGAKLFETEENGAIILIDLNDFKLINDNYGHAAGDAILQATGKVLLQVAQNRHLPARLGGDEFVMYVSFHTLETSLEQFIEDLREQLRSELIIYNGYILHIKPSIGFAIQSPDMTFNELLHEADQKMYEEKQLKYQ